MAETEGGEESISRPGRESWPGFGHWCRVKGIVMLDQAALERRVANLEKMIEVSRTLRSAFDLQSLLQGIIRAIVELVQCERSSILLIEPETGELRFVAA